MDDQETLEREVIEEDGKMPPSREVLLYFLMLGFINIGCGLCFEPRSRGLPAGLLDQPFYGWVKAKRNLPQPASAGLLIEALAVQKRPVLKRLIESTLKRADEPPALAPSAKKRWSSDPSGKPDESGSALAALTGL